MCVQDAPEEDSKVETDITVLVFYYQYSVENVFVGFKAVIEPPVPEHAQRKEHVFRRRGLIRPGI